MFVYQLQLIIGSAGLVNGFIIALFLFFTNKKNARANRILAFLILAVMAKITFYFSSSDLALSSNSEQWIKQIGKAGYFTISPLLWLYLKSVTHKNKAFKFYDFLHLIPTVYLLLAPLFSFPKWTFSSRAGFVQISIYLVVSIVYLWGQYKNDVFKKRPKEFKLLRNIVIGVAILWVDIFLFIVKKFDVFYILELCVLFSLILYFIVYSEFRQVWSKKDKEETSNTKYLNSKLDYNEAQTILAKLQKLMDNKLPYKRHDITLPRLAKMLKVTPHQLSEVINRKTQMNFAEYINSYRIEKAKELLIDPEYAKLKIAFIAHNCGFHSLSTFNTAFKRATNTTPSKYRNEMLFQQAM